MATAMRRRWSLDSYVRRVCAEDVDGNRRRAVHAFGVAPAIVIANEQTEEACHGP
jgi:hypothetical protein